MSDGAARPAPRLGLEAREVAGVNSAWRVRWRVTNENAEPVRLVAVRAPHGRFHADAVDLNLVVADSTAVDQTLRIEAAPGEELTDASVVFVVVLERETWRIVFRVRVRLAPDGTAAPVAEAMTADRMALGEV